MTFLEASYLLLFGLIVFNLECLNAPDLASSESLGDDPAHGFPERIAIHLLDWPRGEAPW